MFFDSRAWPPPTGGDDPPSAPRLSPRQERTLMRLVALFLLLVFVGPLAGSSVIAGMVALLS